MLDVAPDRVTVPLLAAAFRSVLGGVDHSISLTGSTGVGKSELAALLQQHFGGKLDARHLPANWSSTANAIEGMAFACKDVLLVIDDFAPGGARSDVDKAHRDAARIFRSQGNRSSSQHYPVKLLMSGPAGGVAGAIWVARQAGFENLLTFDMGGTSTDVCLVQDGRAQLRRETSVGDFTVRASSVDVRTVGAGGGSIAHVPELTRALRVGPESAGADPGPAAYGHGGEAATVTDADLVLGYLPASVRLGGQMQLDRGLAERALRPLADALDLSLERTAAGIVDIVNENMCGALRLVSVEQGHDPREFALIAFGGAGPMHANALGKLLQAWPVIVPPGPGVLCAYGDATTRLRDEASRSFIRRFSETSSDEVAAILEELAASAARALDAENVPEAEQTLQFQVDVRYHGQGLLLTVDLDLDTFKNRGLDAVGERFDATHEQLFTFALDADKELVNLRAVAQGQAPAVAAPELARGGEDPDEARVGVGRVFMDGKHRDANVYDRSRLRAGNLLRGPAIVTEMDSTTLILSDHVGEVDAHANILIRPDERS